MYIAVSKQGWVGGRVGVKLVALALGASYMTQQLVMILHGYRTPSMTHLLISLASWADYFIFIGGQVQQEASSARQ